MVGAILVKIAIQRKCVQHRALDFPIDRKLRTLHAHWPKIFLSYSSFIVLYMVELERWGGWAARRRLFLARKML